MTARGRLSSWPEVVLATSSLRFTELASPCSGPPSPVGALMISMPIQLFNPLSTYCVPQSPTGLWEVGPTLRAGLERTVGRSLADWGTCSGLYLLWPRWRWKRAAGRRAAGT